MAGTTPNPREDYRNREVDPDLLSPRQVFHQFGIAEQTLANWRSQGKGPRWTKIGELNRPGGFVYYHPADVQAYLDGQVVTVTPAA